MEKLSKSWLLAIVRKIGYCWNLRKIKIKKIGQAINKCGSSPVLLTAYNKSNTPWVLLGLQTQSLLKLQVRKLTGTETPPALLRASDAELGQLYLSTRSLWSFEALSEETGVAGSRVLLFHLFNQVYCSIICIR